MHFSAVRIHLFPLYQVYKIEYTTNKIYLYKIIELLKIKKKRNYKKMVFNIFSPTNEITPIFKQMPLIIDRHILSLFYQEH
jgi:hypothetical protein